VRVQGQRIIPREDRALLESPSSRPCYQQPAGNHAAGAHGPDQASNSQWFFSDSTGVEQFVEEFAKKNKDVFDLEAEEHKLEYTKVYNDFQDQFEKKIEVLPTCLQRGRGQHTLARGC